MASELLDPRRDEPIKAGVVAVQGDVAEHTAAIERAAETVGRSVEVSTIRGSGIVPQCDFLAMPGGESTTISRLIHREGIAAEIIDHVSAAKPLLATCAGLIVASRDAKDDRVDPLGVVDATVNRNAFGRQKDSFETTLSIGSGDPFHAVFIRAPQVASIGDEVEVLARHGGNIVAIRDGSVVGTAFHPELTPDPRVHHLAMFGSQVIIE